MGTPMHFTRRDTDSKPSRDLLKVRWQITRIYSAAAALRKVCIIDYGLCNLDSVARATEECGGLPLITHRPEDLRSCDRVIIPGVGAFGKAVENLRRDGMDEAIRAERERR